MKHSELQSSCIMCCILTLVGGVKKTKNIFTAESHILYPQKTFLFQGFQQSAVERSKLYQTLLLRKPEQIKSTKETLVHVNVPTEKAVPSLPAVWPILLKGLHSCSALTSSSAPMVTLTQCLSTALAETCTWAHVSSVMVPSIKHQPILLSVTHFPWPRNVSIKPVKAAATITVFSACSGVSPNTFFSGLNIWFAVVFFFLGYC